MEVPVLNKYDTSGVVDEEILHHQEEYYCKYRFECGKSFLDICLEMGIDTDNIQISLL